MYACRVQCRLSPWVKTRAVQEFTIVNAFGSRPGPGPGPQFQAWLDNANRSRLKLCWS